MTRIVAIACLLAATPSVGLAQEQSTEESTARHVFDGPPAWEASADIEVRLTAPADMIVCRQGRVTRRSGWRDVYMGCWPTGSESRVLRVPDGHAYLAIRRGVSDLSWIQAVDLHDGTTLHVDREDHETFRIVGWVFCGVGLVGPIVAWAVAVALRALSPAADALAGVTAAGGVLLGVGIGFAAWNDGVRVSVSSPSPPAPSP